MFPAKMLTLLLVPLLHDVGSRVLVSQLYGLQACFALLEEELCNRKQIKFVSMKNEIMG